LVGDVLDAVREAGPAAREMTLTQIARLLPGRVNERAVGTSLQLLEEAGHLRRLWRDEHRAHVKLLLPAAESRRQIDARKKTARATLDGLLAMGLANSATGLALELGSCAGSLGMPEESLRSALGTLDEAGVVEYRPPFRGRGVELVDEPAGTPIRVDFAELARRARREESKLQKMITYSTARRCRGRFILDHFGDHSMSGTCGVCDVCAGQAGPVGAVAERDPAKALRRRAQEERNPRGSSFDKLRMSGGAEGRPGMSGGRPGARFSIVPQTLSPADVALESELRSLRMTLARESRVPPYIVFNDRSLAELVRLRPGTPAELEAVFGFGPTKAVRYGAAILKLLAASPR
ncbi:MAG: HRDC domain-containing protein, partial [Candidatus Wallbacteria bacterium]|nr:HRDC domain-containing protein [Candidatus Wallbacteria bacterium]